MAAAIDLQSYQEPILFLATAGIVVPLFHRLKISPVLGFLAAGALLGPYGLGRLVPAYPWVNWVTFTNPEGTSRLAEFGVVFLLFTIGIELSWQRLRTLRRLVFGFGSLQVFLRALVLGLAFYAFRTVDTITAATVVGLALALSSTAIVIPVLAEQKRLNTAAGRAGFSALLFQDLLVAPILFTIAVLDTGKPEVTLSSFACAAPAGGRCAGSDRRPRPPHPPALLPARFGAEEPRAFHGGLPARRDGDQPDRRRQRPVDGAWRLHRRHPPVRDRIPARRRRDHPALQGPAARGFLRFGRHEPRPVPLPRGAAAHPFARRHGRDRQGHDHRRHWTSLRAQHGRGGGNGASARPRRRVRPRDPRRRR